MNENQKRMSQGHSNRARFAALATGGLLLASVAGCGEEDSVVLEETPVLVGAVGAFTPERAELTVAVSPRDAEGNFVGQGLGPSAFRFEDVTLTRVGGVGLPEPIEVATTGVIARQPDPDAEMTAVVVFDSSGSMAGNDPGALGRIAGAQAFFDILRENDSVALLDFGAGVSDGLTDSRVLQDFTTDRELLESALVELTETGGTPLYESVLDGLSLLEAEAPELGALVVLTDGQAFNGNLSAAILKAQALGVPVYAIGLGSSLDFSDLAELTEQTGGAYVEASDADALQMAFAGVSSGIRLGSVSVVGEGTFDTALLLSRYQVAGDLVTTDGAGSEFVTPFAFTVDVSPESEAVDAGVEAGF